MSQNRPKAIFFDWDGTAVQSRKAPADEAVKAMKPLLEAGIRLVIVSGTTIENIAGGSLEQYFTEKELEFLYMGLGRGAYNYRFINGKPIIFRDCIPGRQQMADLHRACFDVHLELLNHYRFQTDIVFSRPNYCKIDLMVEHQRGDQLFLQENELTVLKDSLLSHGIEGGLKMLLKISEDACGRYGIHAVPTCDAKYLEVGISSKSDNADVFMELFAEEAGMEAVDCTFWGDEFVGIEPGIFGSDSFMITKKTKNGTFFDVSEVKGERPAGVRTVGGGVKHFLQYLKSLS